MDSKPDFEIVVRGPAPFRDRVALAAADLGGAVAEELGPRCVGAIVHADAGGPGGGPAVLAALRRAGAAIAFGAASPRAQAVHAAFLAAGASGTVPAECEDRDLFILLGRMLARRAATAAGGAAPRAAEATGADLFQTVVDALPVSLHVVDRDLRIVLWNRDRETGPLGLPRKLVLGRGLAEALRPDDAVLAEYREVFRSGRASAIEVRGRGDGAPRYYVVEKVPMRLGRGDEVTHVVTFAKDVTAQREMERAMAQAERLAAVGRVAAGGAQEIEAPLEAIARRAERIGAQLAAPLGDEAREAARADAASVAAEALHVKEIVDGLLRFSRPAADERKRVEPTALLDQARRILARHPGTRLDRIEVRVADAPAIHVAEGQTLQALLALAFNAVEAAGPHGAVSLAAEAVPDGTALVVEDDGPGVPEELRERIFEPFFTTKPAGRGTGLGLSVAYALVEANGGRIDVGARPGGGARFAIVFPPAAPGID